MNPLKMAAWRERLLSARTVTKPPKWEKRRKDEKAFGKLVKMFVCQVSCMTSELLVYRKNLETS